MQIKRLKLTGFKSFVEPSELRIEKGLTGIVGPNGCGKSNLLEAIRWVMGESSPKSMRSGGMDDVIFAGTATRPERSFAEVMLLAERGADEALALPGGDGDTDIEIVRRIERGSGSAYRANGRDVRAKDVALIFADAATGAHSPALVSQGRISAIISARPAERRAMLEEAAGIAGLHVRRKDAEQKLRAAEANLARLADLLADMDSRAGQLRRQAKAAERYRRLTDEITRAEAQLIYARWRDAAAAADAAKAEASAAEAQVAAAQDAQADAQKAQASAIDAVALTRTALQHRREAMSDLAHEIATLTGQIETVETRIADLDRQAARIADDGAQEDRLTHDAAEALAALEREGGDLAGVLAALEAERPQLLTRFDNAERAARDGEVALANASAEMARVDAELRVADAALNAAQVRHDRLAADLARSRAALSGEADVAELAASVAAASDRKTAAAAAVVTAQSALKSLESQRDAMVAVRESSEATLSSARAEHSAMARELAALERETAVPAGGTKALDQIRPDTGYERALAAALGDELQAQIGTAAGDGRYWTGAEPSPNLMQPGCTRLSEHVAAPPELAARLQFIWVAEQDAGQPLAPGEQIVTLAGVTRRWDGYVASGEGAATAERLARRNRCQELRGLVPVAAAAVAAAELAWNDAKTALSALNADIGKAGQAIESARSNERAATRALDEAEFAVQRGTERRAELDRQISAVSGEYDDTVAELATARSTRDALPDNSHQSARVAALREASNTARNAMQLAQAALSALDQQLSATRERRAVIRAEIKGWQARSTEAASRIATMAKRRDALAEERAVLAAKPEGLRGQLADRTEARAALAGDTAQCETDAAAAEATLKISESTLAEASEALATAREARAGAAARAENQDQRRVEMGRISGERFQCPPVLLPEKAGFVGAEVGDAASQSATLDRLKQDRERIGPVNLIAADELVETEVELAKGQAESAELTEAIHRLRGSIGSLNREGRLRLAAAFEAVDGHFQRLFARLFNGGQAHLAMIDSEDPLEAGLEIMAQPPGKKLSSLSLLSGGEQALTAVALIFALFLTNPAPICVLDEVDAPLDDANIERFCDLLDAMVTETTTRYLIVTHNAVTMSRMHRLFGVTMIEQGVSRLVSVDLGGAEELLAAE